MFDLFRSRAKAVRYLLGALLLLVAVSMVVTLIPGFGSGVQSDPQIVAEVGKQALSLTEVQQAIQAQLRGRSLPPGMAQAIVPQIANSMVTEYAVAYQAEQMGFRVSESDMASAIRTIFPQLFNGEQFAGSEAYAAVLAQQNMTVPQFEAALRRQLLMSALRGMVVGSVIVSPKDVAAEFHLRNDKAKIEYVTIPPSKYRSEVTVTPEEIKAFYDKNRTGFQVSQTHSFAALIVDEAKLTQSITVPDADLRRVYEQTKDTYRVPERVNVRHILLKTTDKPKQEDAQDQGQGRGSAETAQTGRRLRRAGQEEFRGHGLCRQGRGPGLDRPRPDGQGLRGHRILDQAQGDQRDHYHRIRFPRPSSARKTGRASAAV